MKEVTSSKKYENTPMLFVSELIRRKLIIEPSEFELSLWNEFFSELLQHFQYRVVLYCTSYTISCIKRNHLKDEDGNDIECLYAYFKVALLANIKRYTRPVYIDWFEEE
ncbi:MAG: hypothetical protein E7163_00235 [Firmicutes bacterium]|nr:hypothetical protein [Bacillota bacterium]